MSDLIKVLVRKEYWYEGRHYIPNECLFLSMEIIERIGLDYFIIKSLQNPVKDKMIKTSYQK